MFKVKINALVPLFVAFIFSFFRGYTQECLFIEEKMQQVIETNSDLYNTFIQDLKKCELTNAVAKNNSRVAYHEARILLRNGEIEKADRIIKATLTVQKDKKTIIDVKLLKAASFFIKGELDSCLNISNEVIHLQNNSSIQMARAYQYNANCHGKQGNRHYQYNSIRRGLQFAQKTKDSILQSNFYNSLGNYYNTGKVKDQWKAVQFFKKASALCPVRYSSLKVTYLINLGAMYSALKHHDKSLSVLRQVFNSYTTYLNSEQFFDVTLNMGNTYLVKGDLENAEYFYNKAFETLDKLPKVTSSDIKIYYNLGELEYMKGNMEESRDFLKTYVTLKEKYLAEENSIKIIEIQERFNAKARRAQILEWKNKHQKAKLEKYFLEIVLLVSAVVLAILAGTFFYYYRKKTIAEKLRVKNEIKKAALEATENEKLRFSRDLHDSLGGSLTLVSLLVSQAQEKNPDQKTEFENLYQLVQSSITDLRRVCRDLFPSEILISGVISSIGFYYEKLAALHPSVKFEFTSEDMKLEKGFSVNIYRVVQELTNNSLKYAEATRVEVNMLVINGMMEFTYMDNGKGADQRALRKGVGLNSIEERTKAYKGSFQLETSVGEGFTVMLNFPVNEILINE